MGTTYSSEEDLDERRVKWRAGAPRVCYNVYIAKGRQVWFDCGYWQALWAQVGNKESYGLCGDGCDRQRKGRCEWEKTVPSCPVYLLGWLCKTRVKKPLNLSLQCREFQSASSWQRSSRRSGSTWEGQGEAEGWRWRKASALLRERSSAPAFSTPGIWTALIEKSLEEG